MVFTIEKSGNTYVVLFRSAKHQITSGTDKMNICCFKSFKVHSVRVFIHMVIIDRILTEAFAEDISIRTAAALQVIIACTADQSVVTVFAVQMIIAFATIQYIVTIIAVQGVVAFSSIERIIAIATVDTVVACITIQQVIPVGTVQIVIAQSAI